jgi:hypothetical protein
MILLAMTLAAAQTGQPATAAANNKIERLFAVADTDRNGQLSKSEMSAYQLKASQRRAKRLAKRQAGLSAK